MSLSQLHHCHYRVEGKSARVPVVVYINEIDLGLVYVDMTKWRKGYCS